MNHLILRWDYLVLKILNRKCHIMTKLAKIFTDEAKRSERQFFKRSERNMDDIIKYGDFDESINELLVDLKDHMQKVHSAI